MSSSGKDESQRMRRRFLRSLVGYGGASALLLTSPSLLASGARQVGLSRVSSEQGQTRLVFSLSEPVNYSLFPLPSPHRIVIDIERADWVNAAAQLPRDGLVRAVRSGRRDGDTLRVVLDLARQARPRSFLLPPDGQYGHRLVVDLLGSDVQESKPVKTVADSVAGKTRDLVVAIDPGHGGKDPGAVGRRGTREKDVVLSIARRLETMLRNEPGFDPVLVRSRDHYISLHERTRIARRKNADLFVSLHADGFKDPRARGASVFALSTRGATSEMARWLADKENAADLVGGISLTDKDDELASVLLDLSQTATIRSSLDVGERVLKRLGQYNRLHKQRVQQAGFRVLKSPDIPSILVESAFITNPGEERKLRTRHYQEQVARSVVDGVRDYYANLAPEGTLFARNGGGSYLIRNGDTLSGIASRYNISVSALRRANNLRDDTIHVGQRLQIPAAES